MPDDAADGCASGSSQNATTTDDIAGNATNDGTGCSASFLVRHVGAATQNDQGCCGHHTDRILTNGFHLISFTLKTG